MKKLKINKKIISLSLVLMMMLQIFTSCAPKDSKESTNVTSTQAVEDIKETVEITDHANRKVELPNPDKIEKVFFTSPLGMIYVYTLVPEKLAGLPYDLKENEAKYLLPYMQDLENLGGMQAGAEMNKEKIIDSGAQIIFSIGPNAIDENSISEADKLQEQTSIPVVVVDSNMEKIDKCYKLLGEIFGKEKEAKKLSDYCENTLKDVTEKVGNIPEDKRISVYYAEQNDGLSTEPETSSHAAALKYAGAKNVADVEAKAGSGMSKVSMEQVIQWNPDVIISWGDKRGGAFSQILEDENWSNIQAVKDERVYVMPNSPYSWLDRPPSVNRFLGIQWVANLLYPEEYNIDIVETTKEFYSLFYHVDLTNEEINELLVNSIDKEK